MVQFTAHFDGSVLTPDEFVDIPVNTPLRVTVESVKTEVPSELVDWSQLLDLASECAIEGPEDLAEHHDYYAHGRPKE